ncbi:MAG: hypothetical protein LBF42_03760 [Puniceicoccales bacterium]|nr:hypothetical protein [Puniceicoccales bacterium]
MTILLKDLQDSGEPKKGDLPSATSGEPKGGLAANYTLPARFLGGRRTAERLTGQRRA